ncbi:MAG TPA: hypothetical protein VIP98_16705 [Microlunatus sp.]
MSTGAFVQAASGPVSMELAADQLPCGCCGIVVPRPEKREVRVEHTTAQVTPAHTLNFAEEFGECDRCAELRRLAARIAEAHPKGEAGYGHRFVGQVVNVLVARRLLGMAELSVDIRDVDLGRQIRVLGPAGHQLRFDSAWRLAPRRWSDHAVAAPFAHVSKDDVVRLRRARVDLVAEEAAMARGTLSVAPPSLAGAPRRRSVIFEDRACLWCGIGAVEVSAEQVLRWRAAGRAEAYEPEVAMPRDRFAGWDLKWRRMLPGPMPRPKDGPPPSDQEYAAYRLWHRHEVKRSQLGAGGDRRLTVLGYLCETCEPSTGGLGGTRSALERAVVIACGLKPFEGLQVRGVRGWAADAVDAVGAGGVASMPNDEPWLHMGGVEELKGAIADAVAVLSEKDRDLAREAVESLKRSTGIDVTVRAAR